MLSWSVSFVIESRIAPWGVTSEVLDPYGTMECDAVSLVIYGGPYT